MYKLREDTSLPGKKKWTLLMHPRRPSRGPRDRVAEEMLLGNGVS